MVTLNLNPSPEHRSERPFCPSVYLDSESGTRFAGRAVGVTIRDWQPVEAHANKALVSFSTQFHGKREPV